MVTPREEATTGDRHGSPLAVSNIAESICPAMIRVFPSLEHSGGGCPQPRDNFRTFVQHLPVLPKKHNRAKPMSELASALFSIADASEFRFARFNIVYEGVQLVLPESPPIVSGVSDMPRQVSKRGRDTESSQPWLEEIRSFFPPNAPPSFFPRNCGMVFSPKIFSPEEPCMPPVKTTICFLSSKQDFYDMLFFCIQLFDPLLFDPHGICCPPLPVPVAFHRRGHFLSTLFTLALFRI